MKLKNKISGEIKEFSLFDGKELQGGATLESLTNEWEDYEEPKGHWYLNYMGDVLHTEFESINPEKKIGNYFETKEEAEETVKKLEAWERLKDKKFKFRKWRTADLGGDKYYFIIQAEADDADKADLDLLFCTEDN